MYAWNNLLILKGENIYFGAFSFNGRACQKNRSQKITFFFVAIFVLIKPCKDKTG